MEKGKANEVNKTAMKAGIWYLVSEVLIRGVSFLSTPIFARLLSQAVYGSVKTYESWLYLLTPILSIGIYNSIERAKFDFEEKYDEYVSSVVFGVVVLDLILAGASVMLKRPLAMFFGCSEMLVPVVFLYTAFYTALLCVQKRERQMLQYKNSVIISLLSSVIPVLISVIFVIVYQGRVTSDAMTDVRILSFYIPIIVLGAGVALLAFVRGKKLFNYSYWSYGIKFSAPFIFYSVSMQILNQSDKIMIQKISGADKAGIYAVATTVVYIMDVLNNAVQGAWLPWMFENLNMKKNKEIQKVWTMMLAAMGGLTWLIVMAAPELILFLGGKKYEVAVWLIPPMVTGSLVHFISVGYTNVEKFYKKTGCAAMASLVAMIVNLVLNYYFIHEYGYEAAAYTTATSYLISVLMHWLFMQKYEIENVLPVKNTFLIISGFVCLNLCSMNFYKAPFYIRWGVLFLAVGVVALKFRKVIFDLLNKKILK